MAMRFWIGGDDAAQGDQAKLRAQIPDWSPQMGARFADFEVETTKGRLTLSDWAEGAWVFLFSHPAAFTSVCTSEVLALAEAQPDFDDLGCKILGVTASGVAEQSAWHAEIEEMFGTEIDFPVAEDPMGILADALGLVRQNDHLSCAVRKSFILGPNMRCRMIQEYPEEIGRNTDETLRCIAALQASRKTRLATPADWRPGDRFLNSRPTSAEDRAAAGHGARHMNEYLSLIDLEAATAGM